MFAPEIRYSIEVFFFFISIWSGVLKILEYFVTAVDTTPAIADLEHWNLDTVTVRGFENDGCTDTQTMYKILCAPKFLKIGEC